MLCLTMGFVRITDLKIGAFSMSTVTWKNQLTKSMWRLPVTAQTPLTTKAVGLLYNFVSAKNRIPNFECSMVCNYNCTFTREL